MESDNRNWDVFISYASEDREAVASPLAHVLRQLGLHVWFDQTALKVGDSLREQIDNGLAHCSFGVIILSEAFFAKRWPVRELNGLVQREMASDGRKVILPIWHGVDDAAVRRFSPPLADRVALPWSRGSYATAHDLASVIRPDVGHWHAFPPARLTRKDFSEVLLEQLDATREIVTEVALALTGRSGTLFEGCSQREFDDLHRLVSQSPDIEPMLLSASGRYLYHPWGEKVVGSTLLAEWGEGQASWVLQKLSTEREGYLSWIDGYASDREIEIEFRNQRVGYQRRTVAAFRRIGLASDEIVVFVEGHQIHDVGRPIGAANSLASKAT